MPGSAVRCWTASISTWKYPPCLINGSAPTAPASLPRRFARLVERTRAIQRARGFYNAQMPTRHIRKLCTLDEAGERTLEMAVRRMGLSARAHDRILKLARTIADLGESKTISAKHVPEAVQYRSLDRNYWN